MAEPLQAEMGAGEVKKSEPGADGIARRTKTRQKAAPRTETAHKFYSIILRGSCQDSTQWEKNTNNFSRFWLVYPLSGRKRTWYSQATKQEKQKQNWAGRPNSPF